MCACTVHTHTHKQKVHCISDTVAFERKAHKYNSPLSTFSFLAEMDDLGAFCSFIFSASFSFACLQQCRDMIKCALAIVGIETNYCASAERPQQ